MFICPWAGDAECNQGWIAIFNGENLDGWRNARHHEAENKWFVEDGALTNVEHGTDVATIDEWKDFDLHIEYKTVPGVEQRRLPSRAHRGSGARQLWRVAGYQDGRRRRLQSVRASDERRPGRPGNGTPSTSATSARTSPSTTTVNWPLDGVPITELTGGALPGGVNDPGPLMLQGDHGKVWYRNIRLRPLPPCP